MRQKEIETIFEYFYLRSLRMDNEGIELRNRLILRKADEVDLLEHIILLTRQQENDTIQMDLFRLLKLS